MRGAPAPGVDRRSRAGTSGVGTSGRRRVAPCVAREGPPRRLYRRGRRAMTDDSTGPSSRQRATILAALTRGIARDVDRLALAERLCPAYVEVFGGAGAAITIGYRQPDRLTPCGSDPTVARLRGLAEGAGGGP